MITNTRRLRWSLESISRHRYHRDIKIKNQLVSYIIITKTIIIMIIIKPFL